MNERTNCLRGDAEVSTPFDPPDKKMLRRKYEEAFPLYKQLAEEVEYILSRGISRRKIRIRDIEARVKLFRKRK